jgi:hypothetical protein
LACGREDIGISRERVGRRFKTGNQLVRSKVQHPAKTHIDLARLRISVNSLA